MQNSRPTRLFYNDLLPRTASKRDFCFDDFFKVSKQLEQVSKFSGILLIAGTKLLYDLYVVDPVNEFNCEVEVLINC